MKTARSHSAGRQAAHGALLSLALLTSAVSAAALGAPAAPMTKVGLNKALATLTTEASADVPIGGAVSDTAFLGATTGAGSLLFSLYGPDDTNCGNPPAFVVGPIAAPGDDDYSSGDVTPTVAGTYQWVAEYTDENGRTLTTACPEATEVVVVNQAQPLLSTVASPGVPVGGTVRDTATLANAYNPTGTITFRLFGPGDSVCETAPVFVDEVDVTALEDTYESGFSDPLTAPGTYYWTAFYSGDDNNQAVGTPCNDLNESVVVSPLATPSLDTAASRDTYVGKPVWDVATLSGGVNPTGTITFNLYGPDDPTCERTPVFTSTVEVNEGNADYKSGITRLFRPGTYEWTATYSGDAANEEAVVGCGEDEDEQVVIRKKPPYGGSPRP